jgi:hypothetical protein
MGGMPPMPALPSKGPAMPPLPGMGGSMPSASYPGASTDREHAKEREDKIESLKAKFEEKLELLEKKLSEEREKSLLMQLRSQEESVTAAKVEASLKEMQDKLRRDRRDQDSEEAKLKLERRAQELEARLAQERETWVNTLKGQLSARETQDKEVESHFALRLQEMERRWLEEKAQWQKTALAKDEEVRTLRALAEKLKGADLELSRHIGERKLIDERLAAALQDRAEFAARMQSASEREKEAIQLRADLQLARQQGALIQERLERDMAALRQSSREREERLQADMERLHRDMATIKERLQVEHEADLRRAKAEHEADLIKHKDAAEKAVSELQRLRGVTGALERQNMAARTQLEALRRASADWEKTQERYKAEFVVLQRKWVEREKEVRAEAAAQSVQMLDSEKTRLRIQAQDELNTRAAKIADQLRQENESEQKRLETRLRAELERELIERRAALQAEVDAGRAQADQEIARLRRELQQKDSAWGERLLVKEADVMAQRARADEMAGRLSREEELRVAGARERLELEKRADALREQLSAAQVSLREQQDRVAAVEADKTRLSREKAELERATTAQAAQIKGSQEALEASRLQLTREAQNAQMVEKALIDQKTELLRVMGELDALRRKANP